MVTLFIILLILVSVALGLFILVQNPKGGGLVSGSSSSNMFGVQRTGDVLEKGTWVLISIIVVLSLGLTYMGKSETAAGPGKSKIDNQINALPNASPIGGALSTPAPSNDTTKK